MTLGHAAMLLYFGLLLAWFEPDPNGLRFDDIGTLVTYAAWSSPPLFVGLATRSRAATIAAAAIHVASPSLLIASMLDPSGDLNFALLMWWFPVPVAVAAIAATDQVRHALRATKRKTTVSE